MEIALKRNKTFVSKLEAIKNIEERNTAFESLSDEDKRKEIAYDCFILTLSGKIQGSAGCYWSPKLEKIKARTAKAFQEKLVNDLPECKVCARGGMMLSQIRLGNSISHRDDERVEGSEEILKGFDIISFLDMENEYEREYYNHPYESRTTEKLQNICLNVIVNGDFNTKDNTDYLAKLLSKIKKQNKEALIA